jgi:hypothetical protein
MYLPRTEWDVSVDLHQRLELVDQLSILNLYRPNFHDLVASRIEARGFEINAHEGNPAQWTGWRDHVAY